LFLFVVSLSIPVIYVQGSFSGRLISCRSAWMALGRKDFRYLI